MRMGGAMGLGGGGIRGARCAPDVSAWARCCPRTDATNLPITFFAPPPPHTHSQRYGKIFRLSFGPKTFVVISDPAYVKQILQTNADK